MRAVATLIVHGGAGRRDPALPREPVDAGLERALDSGFAALPAGAMEAVVAAVRTLEDDPIFNAGRGAVLTAAGTVELDAGVMVAEGLRAGAVAGMTDSANPVEVARAVLLDGRHVILVGDGASHFAAERGLRQVDPEWLRAEARPVRRDPGAGGEVAKPDRVALGGAAQSRRANGSTGAAPHGGDTVGAVCWDGRRGFAVAVSTGGIAGKLPGRVGDSAVCGAGFYADSAGAACATGRGEDFIRLAGCRRAVELLDGGMDAQAVASRLIEELTRRIGGEGGIIVVDAAGRPGVAHNTPDMPWAWRTETAAARW